MPRRPIDETVVAEIRRRLRAGESERAVTRHLALSRMTVRKYAPAREPTVLAERVAAAATLLRPPPPRILMLARQLERKDTSEITWFRKSVLEVLVGAWGDVPWLASDVLRRCEEASRSAGSAWCSRCAGHGALPLWAVGGTDLVMQLELYPLPAGSSPTACVCRPQAWRHWRPRLAEPCPLCRGNGLAPCWTRRLLGETDFQGPASEVDWLPTSCPACGGWGWEAPPGGPVSSDGGLETGSP